MSKSSKQAMRVAGCDLGKASASFVTATASEDGSLIMDSPTYVLHDGKPFQAFEHWYRENQISNCAVLGATGVYAAELTKPALLLPEDSCQEAALGRLTDLPETLNLVSVGARGYGALSRSSRNHRPMAGRHCPSCIADGKRPKRL